MAKPLKRDEPGEVIAPFEVEYVIRYPSGAEKCRMADAYTALRHAEECDGGAWVQVVIKSSSTGRLPGRAATAEPKQG
jgi:hypothetical protein